MRLGNFNWLSADNALYASILVDVWIYTPFVAILVLAGIRSLPKEPFEASAVDDASALYMFRRLMLPLIWPYILVAVIFRFMDCLKIFDIPYVLTGGGPGVATTTLQINAFNDLIKGQQYSRGTTYMLILWILVFITARVLVGCWARPRPGPPGPRSRAHMARRELMPGQRRITPGVVGGEVLTILWFVFSLFPILWMILLSLKSTADQQVTFFSFKPTLSNFSYVLTGDTGANLRSGLFESLVTSIGAVLVSLIIGIPAAYAAGRWKYKAATT